MRHEKDEFDTLHWVIVIGTIALVIAGLIEFNARRQAAAVIAQLTRPMSPAQQAEFDRQMAADEAEGKAIVQQLWANPPASRRRTPSYDTRPLNSDERCIEHQRFQRLENGWRQIGTCQ